MSTTDTLTNQIRKAFSASGKPSIRSVEPPGKQDIFYQCALFFSVFVLLFVCTRNSPAFVYQNWVDPSTYMNVSRAMQKGAVLYRDVFDHKGPLLYLVLVVFSALPVFSFSMTGLYLLQCVTLSVTLRYLYRTARIFLNSLPSLGIGFVFLFFLLNDLTYSQGGGSVEELLLPVFTIALYELVRFYGPPAKSDTEKLSPSFFRLGILIGVTTLVKINLAFFLVTATAFLLASFVFSRDGKGFCLATLKVLAGGLTAALPCIVYWAATSSFSDFWQAYIDFNVLYARQSGNDLNSSTFISATADILFLNMASVICLILGFICFLINRNKFRLLGQIGLAASFSVLFFTEFASNRPYPYFFIPLLSFVGLSEIAIVATIQNFFYRERKESSSGRVRSVLRVVAGILLVLLIALFNGQWSDTRFFYPEKTGVEIISEEILATWRPGSEETYPNILLLDCGDSGFYQLTKSIPGFRFFYRPMIGYPVYPDVLDAQIGYIRDGTPDYVIITSPEESWTFDLAKLNSAYVLIDKQEEKSHNSNSYIWLFQKQTLA